MNSDGSKLEPELPGNPFPEARRSASADSSLRAEIQRVGKMTVEERIRAALSMEKRFEGLQKTAKQK